MRTAALYYHKHNNKTNAPVGLIFFLYSTLFFISISKKTVQNGEPRELALSPTISIPSSFFISITQKNVQNGEHEGFYSSSNGE